MAANIVTQPVAEAVLASVAHDDRTTGGLFLPHFGNSVRLDIARLRATIILLDGLVSGALDAADVQAIVSAAIAGVVDSSPATLDTLNELAAALGDDPNFAATIATQIGQKASTADVNTALALRAPLASPAFTGNPTAPTPAVGDNDTSIATTEFVRAITDALLAKAGGTITGRLNLEFATLAANNGAANFANRNGYNASQTAAMTLTVSNLADGQDGQVNLTYSAGALSFTGVDRWVVGNAEVQTAFSATEVGSTGLVANGVYQFVFSKAADIVVGRVGRVK